MDLEEMELKKAQKNDPKAGQSSGADISSDIDQQKKAKRHKMHVAVRILCCFAVVVVLLCILVVSAFFVMSRKGEQGLRDKTVAGSRPNLQFPEEEETLPSLPQKPEDPDNQIPIASVPETEATDGSEVATDGDFPVIETPETETAAVPETESSQPKEEIVWDPDWVKYKNKIYDFNEDIFTFLVMGIDKNEEVTETSGTNGGQSDFLFLVVVNQDKEQIDLIAINRDTMTDVYMYGYMNIYGEVPVATAQITTQHGFGDGKEESCRYTCEAVSGVFFNLPINGYVSLNLAGVPVLNDAIGGVSVTIPQDMTAIRSDWVQGTSVHLMGQDSYYFLKWRDINVFESNRTRLERQKQYLQNFIAKVMDEVKSDITLPVTLYRNLTKYMVTDISVDEVTYMVSKWLNYKFGTIYSMKGETVMGAKHEEFYPDYNALRELVLDLFYDEVILP